MRINPNKIKQINGLAESSLIATFTAAANYAKFLIERGGIYALPLLPFMELIKACLYWSKARQSDFTDSRLKIGLNHSFNAFKVLASGVGAGFALAGMLTVGFGIMIVSGYLNMARSLGKAARSALAGDTQKVANNLGKSLIGGMISTGFLLMTFFPTWGWMGGISVLVATGHVILSLLPGVIAGVPLPDTKVVRSLSIRSSEDDPSSSVGFNNMIRNSLSNQEQSEESKTLLGSSDENILDSQTRSRSNSLN